LVGIDRCIAKRGRITGQGSSKAAYEKLGITPDKRVITSCGQGQMSAHTYFTLKYILGYPNIRNYDGSFNEWSNIEGLPVETGMKP
jgi:thiosulfate/3-mercaptopyruvate sulfurtransferase